MVKKQFIQKFKYLSSFQKLCIGRAEKKRNICTFK